MTVRQRWSNTSLPNKLLVGTGALVAFGTLFYAGAAVFQLCLIEQSGRQTDRQIGRIIGNINWLARSMDLSQKQAQLAMEASDRQSRDALNASIKALRLEQRAWINITTSDVAWLQDGQPVSVTVQISNAGKTAAKHFDMNIRVSILPSGTDPEFIYTPGHSRTHFAGAAILPSIPISHPVEALDNKHPPQPIILTTVQREQINQGELIFYVYGMATYDDIFGTHHWSQFCKFSGGLPGSAIPPGKPSKKCAAYNDVDNN